MEQCGAPIKRTKLGVPENEPVAQTVESSAPSPIGVAHRERSGQTLSIAKHGKNEQHRQRLYHNLRMTTADGKMLATIDAKKMKWYLSRGLAEQTSSDTIRLLFTPKLEGREVHPFYTEERENVCVVCGSIGPFRRHFVVPSTYRKHFPEHLKKHCCHDVLLLCLPCHREADSHGQTLMKIIAEEQDVPLDPGKEEQRDLRDMLTRIGRCRGIASTLLKSGAKIPPSRTATLRGEIDTMLLDKECVEMYMVYAQRYAKLLNSSESASAAEAASSASSASSSFEDKTDAMDFLALSRRRIQMRNRSEAKQVPLPKDEGMFCSVGLPDLKDDELALLSRLVSKIPRIEDSQTHGAVIMNRFSNSAADFAERWRSHFISRMEPRFLPKHWSVKHSRQ